MGDRRAGRLAAILLMWLGAWLLLLAAVSAGQTAALDAVPPDLGPSIESVAPAGAKGQTLSATATLPLSVLPETRLPSDEPAAVAPADQGFDAQSQMSDLTPSLSPKGSCRGTGPCASTGGERGEAPSRLVIPAIGLDAPVRPVGLMTVTEGGQTYYQWQVPDGFAAGWFDTSAPPGQPGNTVLDGHHNIRGQVFRYLVNLKPGDTILVYAGEQVYRYIVRERHILLEKGQSLAVRLKNAEWIQPTADERLTLVTCWPYTNNTHRLIVVAVPVPDVPDGSASR